MLSSHEQKQMWSAVMPYSVQTGTERKKAFLILVTGQLPVEVWGNSVF